MRANEFTTFRGYLDSVRYAEVAQVLLDNGVNFVDECHWLEMFYWDDGLYQVTQNTVYPIFSFNICRPHVCKCLNFKRMAFQLRPEV